MNPAFDYPSSDEHEFRVSLSEKEVVCELELFPEHTEWFFDRMANNPSHRITKGGNGRYVLRRSKEWSNNDWHSSSIKTYKFKKGETDSEKLREKLSKNGLTNRHISNVAFCDGECGQICCDIRGNSDWNQLYFVGAWSDEERSAIRTALLNGSYPEDHPIAWHDLNLEYGASVVLLCNPHKFDIQDVTAARETSFNELLQQLPYGVDMHAFFPGTIGYRTEPVVIPPNEVSEGEEVDVYYRAGSYNDFHTLSIGLRRVETKRKLFSNEKISVRYLIGDLDEYLSQRLLPYIAAGLELRGIWHGAPGEKSGSLGAARVYCDAARLTEILAKSQ